MHHKPFLKTAAVLATLLCAGIGPLAHAQLTNPPALTASDPGGKTILLPARIDRIPNGNDFSNPDSEYSFKHSRVTKNFVLFWAKEYGDDPMTNAANRRFDVDGILKEADRYYDFYINDLKWVDPATSYATKYKFIFVVFGGPNAGGTAFGGSIPLPGGGRGAIGAFWTPASRINRGPYGVVAHELGHSFQAMDRADGAESTPSFGEMTSQYMLWQVLPEWLTFENYHFVAYMKATHLAFLNPENQYHTAEVPEYWSEKRGLDFMGKMWRETQRGEDVVTTYKRLTGITQAQFDDEMFDADRHFITWDLPRIEKVAAPYRNMDTTSINKGEDGWYQIAKDKCPQNYGYNAIQLKVPAPGTKISLDFKGIVGAEGFQSVQPEKAGWRYGFLAYNDDNTRVYSDTFSKSPGTAEFTVPADTKFFWLTIPANTKFLWLVVTGAPTEHWIRAGGRGGGGGGNRRGGRGATNTITTTNTVAVTNGNAIVTVTGTTNAQTLAVITNMLTATPATNVPAGPRANANAYEQWPYAFKLTGTTPVDSIIH